MGLSASLSQGYSAGGSQNSGWSMNESGGGSLANSWTDAMSARQWSAYMADIAWQRDMEAFQRQMDFNAEEAQKQRDWQTEMANTIYTRSVANMKEAGINPILAANMGLSGAGVGSGATASIGGAPSAPLAQSFMDSYSASNAWNSGWGRSENEGSSWQSSENGLVTALSALGSIVSGALESLNAGQKIEFTVNGLEDFLNKKYDESPITKWANETGQGIRNKISEGAKKEIEKVADFGKNIFNKVSGGGHGF